MPTLSAARGIFFNNLLGPDLAYLGVLLSSPGRMRFPLHQWEETNFAVINLLMDEWPPTRPIRSYQDSYSSRSI